MSDVVLKVNFAPYLLMLDLPAPVKDFEATGTFVDNTLTVRLPKVDPAVWGAAQIKGASKVELVARRAASLEKRAKEEAELREKKMELKNLAGRTVLRKQVRAAVAPAGAGHG